MLRSVPSACSLPFPSPVERAVIKIANLPDITQNCIFVNKPVEMDLKKHISDITILCRQNKVRTLYVFGSVLTDKFNESSDIDFIVEIDSDDPLEYAENYFNLKFALEEILKRQIDLLENKTIKNQYLKESIDKSKSLIYAS
jgi:predicted nucleotidyltransferase